MVMLKALLEDQRRFLDSFFHQLDILQAEKVLDKLYACKGIVLVTGVGKSGLIAEKVSTTFLSTGTRSFFLSPLNALHGDIGALTNQDLLLMFSKSGESQELIDLIPYVKNKKAFTIAIISSAHSTLARLCDLSLVLPVQREICPYDLAPTTSTVEQLIFGDCLAIALMKKRKFSIEDFAANHPSGILGRKITCKVEQIMLKEGALPLCKPSDKLIAVLHELSLKRCGCLVIADEKQRLQGIFTDGDLRRALQNMGSSVLEKTLAELMTKSPKWITSDQLAIQAVKAMEEDPARLITVLPVVEKGRVVGLIRMHDILQKEWI